MFISPIMCKISNVNIQKMPQNAVETNKNNTIAFAGKTMPAKWFLRRAAKINMSPEELQKAIGNYKKLETKRILGEKLTKDEISLIEHYITSCQIPMDKLTIADARKRLEFFVQEGLLPRDELK